VIFLVAAFHLLHFICCIAFAAFHLLHFICCIIMLNHQHSCVQTDTYAKQHVSINQSKYTTLRLS
jgi:hypothetical protein